MAQDDEELPPSGTGEALRRPRRGRRWFLVLLVLLTLCLAYVWFSRERIADDFISDRLAASGVPATYDIVSIGPRRQVLKNIVVGDPARPDLVIERAEVSVVIGWGTPGIDHVVLVKPRLFGSYRRGKLSFGSLDPLVFADSKEPFRLPDMQLRVVDGRALLASDAGPIGVKLDGSGALRGGFSAELAAIAPRLEVGGCLATRASAYGTLRVSNEKPRFNGPLRLGGLDCGAKGLRLADVGIGLDAVADRPLDGVQGSVGLRSGVLEYAAHRMASATGTARFTYRKQALTARYTLAGSDIETPGAAAASLKLTGLVRGDVRFARIETEGEVAGRGLRLGANLDAALIRTERAGEGTLVAPLLGRMRRALQREGRDSAVAGTFLLRRSGRGLDLVVPQASLRGSSGQTLLALSRFQLSVGDVGTPRLSGNFSTAGEGLPRIAGRMEQVAGGHLAMRIAVADYRAGNARVSVPALVLVQLPNGALGFSGEASLSGALPGGVTENLALPLQGNWSPGGGLTLWSRCMSIGFDRLGLASVTFDRRRLHICPPSGGAIVRSDARGTRIAAGVPSLDVSGRLGATPIRIRSGALGIAVPGTLAAKALDVTLGPAATASHFRIANLDARIGGEVAGRFKGADILLAAVPLDILAAGGDWRFAGGRLTLSNAAFRIEDRQLDDRFQPLTARGATLRLANNVIAAEALLREPQSDREIVRTTIRHDLASGRGLAELAVDGIVFDARLQPDTLSRLALGVVANASGVVRGQGRIAWDERAVTSSGRFATGALDFAAAFGPVKGASGTVVFTDLLGLVTAPDQKLSMASINPGIEVNDGVLTFEMQPGSVLQMKGGSWPFLDGRLTLRPVTMRMGIAETRRYVLVIEGLDAARFIERMELVNISATGTFDGILPLVFDENGGRIEGGLLTARPPGGNVSYVGALSYEDLSAMANFAFDALKSLDYREMSIGMDGAIEGEIVTRVRFRGIRQGVGAERNFLTDRIAKLPIQFNVNLRAPFLSLISSFKSFHDPAYVRDPRELGLMDAQERSLKRAPGTPAPIQP